MTYEEYIRSPEWVATKQRYRQERPWRCWVCRIDRGLQLHHLTYVRFQIEHLDDLVPLCGGCHINVHRSRESDETIQSATERVRREFRQYKKQKQSIRAAKNAAQKAKKLNTKWTQKSRWLADKLGLPEGQTTIRYTNNMISTRNAGSRATFEGVLTKD